MLASSGDTCHTRGKASYENGNILLGAHVSKPKLPFAVGAPAIEASIYHSCAGMQITRR
jgi:hypothetical protein